MSSNQSNSKRLISISRKLQWMVEGKRIRRALWDFIWLSILLVAGWLMGLGLMKTNTLLLNNICLDLINYNSLDTIAYTLTDTKTGTIIVNQLLFPVTYYLVGLSGGICVLRIFGVLLDLRSDHNRIESILSPIDEIAVRADELSRLEFSEDKYQLLEDAINNIEPDENQSINLKEKELQGISTAMNNLMFRMKESYKQQARFVNDASHELRTPIAVIEGYANMLSRWGREDEKVLDESITAIKNEATHMKHLVEQLLFLARGDSGKTTLNRENTNLNDMMREIYEESLMIDENHTYRFSNWGDDLFAEVDSGLIKQAVRILVDNAAKYTNAGDEIQLAVGLTEDNRKYLQVQDTGIGMSDADVEHMFERFYRADKARNTEGNGLGLSIAKWIVDKHGGYFSITSRTELGTRIRIVL